jgi:hypothetical protein
MVGRIDGGTKVIVDNTTELSAHLDDGTRRLLQPGDYVHVEVPLSSPVFILYFLL